MPAEQRPTTDDYHRYLVLLETLRSEGYRPDPNTPPFIYGDVGFTSILAQAEEDLIWLWAELGEVGTEAMSRHESLCEGLGRAWDDTAHAFLDRDLITETRIAESADCSSTLMPLYAGVVDTDQSAYLSEGLWDENRFGPS